MSKTWTNKKITQLIEGAIVETHQGSSIPLPLVRQPMVETEEQRSRRRDELLALGADYVNAFSLPSQRHSLANAQSETAFQTEIMSTFG